MKRFIIKVICFLAIMIVIDCVIGTMFSTLLAKAKGGNNARNNYINDYTTQDILIFGSSRAFHHYNPKIITDSTGLSCYNCGQDGNGIILNYGRLNIIKERYIPKLVLYDVTPSFDLLLENDNTKYLAWLKAYYDKDGIKEIFDSVNKNEKIKMLSNMYRYNSKCLNILIDAIHPMKSIGINGFRPLPGEMDTMKVSKKEIQESYDFDPLKLYYLDKFITDIPNTRIVFIVSPSFNGIDGKQLEPIRQICKQRGLELLDMSNTPKYLHNPMYFKDGDHLNSIGADEFTIDIVRKLSHSLPCKK